MKKENKWLIIYALIFLVAGFLFSMIIHFYNEDVARRKILTQYEEYFADVKSFKWESLTDDDLEIKVTLYDKNKKEIGKAYIGSGIATGIPGHGDEQSVLRIQVIVDANKVIKGAFIDYSEHTPDFVAHVDSYFQSLSNTPLIDYKKVDEVAGASTFSMPIVRRILDKVTFLETGSEPNPKEDPDPYLDLFGPYDSIIEDAGFAPTELVIKKEIIKDEDGTILGFAYTATGFSDEVLHGQYHNEVESITLLVGIGIDGKVKGVITLESNHTPGFYGKYEEKLQALSGVDKDDLNVDLDTDASISGRLINRLLNAVKGVHYE